jgi:hypothetical protein
MSFDRRRAGQNSDAGCPTQVSRVGPAQPRLGRMSASPPRATKHSHRSETPLCANSGLAIVLATDSIWRVLIAPYWTVFPKVISGLRKPIAIQAAISFNINLPE